MSLTVGKRIWLGFSMVLVLVAVVAIVGYVNMRRTMGNITAISRQVEITKRVAAVNNSATDAQADSLRYVIYNEKDYLKNSIDECDQAIKAAKDAGELMTSEENKRAINEAAGHAQAYKAANQEYADLHAKLESASSIRLKAAEDILTNIRELLDVRHKLIQERAHDSDKGKVTDLDAVLQTFAAQQARDAFNRVRVSAQKYQLAVGAADQDAAAKEWIAEIETTRKLLNDCKTSMKDAASQKEIDESIAALNTYQGQVDVFRQLYRQQRDVQMNKQRPAAKALMARCDDVTDGVYKVIAATDKEANSQVALANTLIIAIGVGALIAGTLASFFIARSITGPVRRIADTLAAGADQTASAAGQVSASSQSLAQGASEQAASLEETSSSLEEMSSMTKKNAESARQAAGLSAEAKSSADKGNQAMNKMSAAINEIQKSAAATAKIIKVIDEIAFQTNLLALNAAVEAARAGEAGKGFAVVAEEVRNLAMRSAEAAKNTATMIEESVQNAKNGVAITTEVAGILEEITASNTKVNSLVGEISAASQEQTTGIDQVNIAVGQMDKVTQSNAANAEESASASEELSSQAEQMQAIVRELTALVNGVSAAVAEQSGSSRTLRRPSAQPAATRSTSSPNAKPSAGRAIPLDETEKQVKPRDFAEFSKAA